MVCFLDRQRVHVGAQPDHLDVGARGRLAALDDADHAGAAEAGCDLIATEFPQPVGHECRGAVHVVHQFGMGMDIPAPGLNIRLQIGDAIDDGHEQISVRVDAFSCLARGRDPPNTPVSTVMAGLVPAIHVCVPQP